MGIEDALGQVTVDTIKGDQPTTSTAVYSREDDSQLVSTSIHLAPLCFYESIRCCLQKKLLEQALADKIWVSCPFLF